MQWPAWSRDPPNWRSLWFRVVVLFILGIVYLRQGETQERIANVGHACAEVAGVVLRGNSYSRDTSLTPAP